MKRLFFLTIMALAFGGITFASTSGDTKHGGPYGANWGGSDVGTVANNIASSETYPTTSDTDTGANLTNDELADIESLILLVIEKQRGTLDLTAKDVVKARNMQRTYMLATMIPRTGANPVAVTNIFPAELPATGSSERNVLFLLMSLLGVIGLATTLFWKRA